jgi:hypothetical protein
MTTDTTTCDPLDDFLTSFTRPGLVAVALAVKPPLSPELLLPPPHP